jgi:FtsZ-binding cell division protein ZapB
MMRALQLQVESLKRQVEKLGPENERVRNLLTEFDQRHDADQNRIAALTAERDALALQVQRARDDALEEAAQTASARHLAWQEQAGACLVDDDISACSDIADAIRALRGATEGAGG